MLAAVSVLAALGAVASCSVLEPEETGLAPDSEIVVTSSAVPSYQAEDTPDTEVTENLSAPVEDAGLGVTWEFQGVYSDDIRGSVITFMVKNDNEVPLPPDAIAPPTLEVSDGLGGYTPVEALEYDPEVNTTVLPPGLDAPLGVGASTNLQYRFDSLPGNLWDARVHIGNVTWIGNLNL